MEHGHINISAPREETLSDFDQISCNFIGRLEPCTNPYPPFKSPYPPKTLQNEHIAKRQLSLAERAFLAP